MASAVIRFMRQKPEIGLTAQTIWGETHDGGFLDLSYAGLSEDQQFQGLTASIEKLTQVSAQLATAKNLIVTKKW